MFEFEAKRELLEYFLQGRENEIIAKLEDLNNNVDYPSYHNINSGRYMPGMASVEEQVINRLERREKLEKALERIQERKRNVATALQSLNTHEIDLIKAVVVRNEVLPSKEYQTFLNAFNSFTSIMNNSETKRREKVSATIEYNHLKYMGLTESMKAQRLQKVIVEAAV